MASGKHVSCGPCMFVDVTKDSWRWCTNCEEGLCADCENVHRKSKSSRNHKVITIEDYRKIENISISNICEQHGENLEWLCKSHDEVLCVACVPSTHKACPDVIPIGIYSTNSRQSAALSVLEETIEDTLQNAKQCIKNRESATKEIEKQELTVKTMVLETRTKINDHLDKLQEKLLLELRSASQICKSKYTHILKKLKSTEKMVTKLKEETKHMKQFSSDIQVFLGTRQVNKRIINEIESIKSEIGVAKDYELKVSIHSLIEKLANDVDDFGQIKVSECNAINFDLRDPKLEQAQIETKVPTSRNISSIKLQLIKSCQMSSTSAFNISGCVILPNGHLLMANATKDNNLIETSDTGEHIRDILVSSAPFDIAVIDLNHIVVTYGEASFIEIINTDTFNVEKKITLPNICLGVSHADGKLYVVHGGSVQVMDLSGKNIKTIKTVSNNISRIIASTDRIIYSDWKNNKVHCFLLHGEEFWQIESDGIKFAHGVTVDNYHNVYVLCYSSNNLTIIQNDGSECKTLLTKSDGLLRPQAMYYDKDTNTLLIGNRGGKIALYKVV